MAAPKEQVIKVRRWPPEFRLCSWCEWRRVKDDNPNTRWCKVCDDLITRDQMGRGSHSGDEPDSEENLLFQHERDKVFRP